MALNMGISQVVGGDWSKMFLRKYRWVLQITNLSEDGGGGDTEGASFYGQNKTESIIYVASRPNFTAVEQELVHAIESIHYPGRAQWEPVELVMWNVAGDRYLYKWLKTFYDPETGEWRFWQNAVRNITLRLMNGIGEIAEQWTLQECWPANINWGELDYTSSELAETRVTLRYSRAVNLETSSAAGGPGGESGGQQ